MRYLKLQLVYVLSLVLSYVYCVVMGVVGYGSVMGVWGVPSVRLFATLVSTSFSISPVDVWMEFVLVTPSIAVFVRSWSWRMRKSSAKVGVVVLRDVVRWHMASGAKSRAASILAAICSVLLNL